MDSRVSREFQHVEGQDVLRIDSGFPLLEQGVPCSCGCIICYTVSGARATKRRGSRSPDHSLEEISTQNGPFNFSPKFHVIMH